MKRKPKPDKIGVLIGELLLQHYSMGRLMTAASRIAVDLQRQRKEIERLVERLRASQ